MQRLVILLCAYIHPATDLKPATNDEIDLGGRYITPVDFDIFDDDCNRSARSCGSIVKSEFE